MESLPSHRWEVQCVGRWPMKRSTQNVLLPLVVWGAIAGAVYAGVTYMSHSRSQAEKAQVELRSQRDAEIEAKNKQEEALLSGDAALDTLRERLSSWASAGPGFVLTTDKWSEATIYSANTPWSVRCEGRALEVRILGDVDIDGGYEPNGGPRTYTISSRVPKGRCTALARDAALLLRGIFRNTQQED